MWLRRKATFDFGWSTDGRSKNKQLRPGTLKYFTCSSYHAVGRSSKEHLINKNRSVQRACTKLKSIKTSHYRQTSGFKLIWTVKKEKRTRSLGCCWHRSNGHRDRSRAALTHLEKRVVLARNVQLWEVVDHWFPLQENRPRRVLLGGGEVGPSAGVSPRRQQDNLREPVCSLNEFHKLGAILS